MKSLFILEIWLWPQFCPPLSRSMAFEITGRSEWVKTRQNLQDLTFKIELGLYRALSGRFWDYSPVWKLVLKALRQELARHLSILTRYGMAVGRNTDPRGEEQEQPGHQWGISVGPRPAGGLWYWERKWTLGWWNGVAAQSMLLVGVSHGFYFPFVSTFPVRFSHFLYCPSLYCILPSLSHILPFPLFFCLSFITCALYLNSLTPFFPVLHAKFSIFTVISVHTHSQPAVWDFFWLHFLPLVTPLWFIPIHSSPKVTSPCSHSWD